MTLAKIHDLVGRYCEAVLRNDPQLFAQTWTTDATWAVPGAGEIVGRDAIVDTFTSIRSGYPLCVQQILNGTLSVVDEHRAVATHQVRELQWRADGSGSELIGVYHDELSADGAGEWRFSRRDFELLYDGPVDLRGRLRTPRTSATGE